MRWLLTLAIVIGLGAPARADGTGAPARGQSTVIALLPLAADAKLAIYGQPVSSEVARALEVDGFSIVVVTSTAPVPSKARLVIDGRIVRGDGDTVLIEARVRDPSNSKIVAELTASAPSLTRIDEAAADLAARLGPILRERLAGQSKTAVGSQGVSTGKGGDGGDRAVVSRVVASADPRPLAVISVTSAVTAGPDDPVLDPLLRAGAVRLAGLIGHRSEDVRSSPGAALADALPAQQAAVAVEIALLGISYDDGGVITARARARVRVIDADGTVFSRVVRTDTLVGGRGDRRDAVARAAIDQIVDVAMPRVREQLAARKDVTP